MASDPRRRRALSWRRAVIAVLGSGAIVAGGFAFGLVAGIIWEEPRLIAGYVAGESEEIDLSPGKSEAKRPEPGPVPPVSASPAEPGAQRGAAERRQALPGGSAEPGAQRGAAERRQALPGVSVGGPPQGKAGGSRPRSEVKPSVGGPPLYGRFAVQVGAFADSRSAERLAQSLRDKGMGVYVSPGTQRGDARWRVRVGPIESRAAAGQVATRLKSEEQLPTWVVREGGF